MENFAALIAIDWADKKHAVSLYDETAGGREQTTIKHTPEALQVANERPIVFAKSFSSVMYQYPLSN